MKVERKKAREELDVVSVIEWRTAIDDADRWFLLVRRPEGGESLIFFTPLPLPPHSHEGPGHAKLKD